MSQSKMYQRHRFPPEIIHYAVWLYHRFSLSYRDIEDLLVQRSIRVGNTPIGYYQKLLYVNVHLKLTQGGVRFGCNLNSSTLSRTG